MSCSELELTSSQTLDRLKQAGFPLTIDIGYFSNLMPEELVEATKAVKLFEELLIPSHIMTDSPELMTPEWDELAAMWSYIGAVDAQAELETVHHGRQDVKDVALAVIAKMFRNEPLRDVRVDQFIRVVGCMPREYLAINNYN